MACICEKSDLHRGTWRCKTHVEEAQGCVFLYAWKWEGLEAQAMQRKLVGTKLQVESIKDKQRQIDINKENNNWRSENMEERMGMLQEIIEKLCS